MDAGNDENLDFSDAATGGATGKNGKSGVTAPQVFPLGPPQSRYAEQHQAPPYSEHDNRMNVGYGPDPTNVQYRLPSHPGPQPVTQQPTQTHTTVVIQQQQQVPQVKTPRVWSTEMCSCFADIGVCCLVCFCGECYACCGFMDRVGESCCFPCCFPGAWMGAVRSKIRSKYNIQGSMMDDFCLTSGCCACFTRYCVFCQMIREVKMMEQMGEPM